VVILSQIEDLLIDVEILRGKLINLIDKKQGNLVDFEVINSSKILDETLNQYNQALEEKLKCIKYIPIEKHNTERGVFE
jgi:hypothetical protein